MKLILNITVFLFSFCGITRAQYTTYTPYSRYAIGDINEGLLGAQFSAGHQTVGFRSPFHVNVGNPASYTAMNLTTFDFGIINNNNQFFSSDSAVIKSRVTSFSYMTLGLPVKRRWATCIGILPYSGVGYNISDQENITNVGTVQYKYTGQGGTNRILFGNAFKIIDDSVSTLSFGINTSFIFGSIENTRKIIFNDTLKAFNVRVLNTKQMEGFHFNAGLQYHLVTKNDNTLTIGATGAMQNKLSIKEGMIAQRYTQREIDGIVTETYRDTLLLKNERGILILPSSFGFGITWGRRKGQGMSEHIKVGADYRIQNWSDYRSFGNSDNLANSNKFALGVHYIPVDAENAPDWIKLSMFRFGAYYANTFLNLKNRQLNDMGLTFGWGLPVPLRKRSKGYSGSMNIGLNYGRRGTTEDNLIRENYFNVMLNFTLNDRWFIKRKID